MKTRQERAGKTALLARVAKNPVLRESRAIMAVTLVIQPAGCAFCCVPGVCDFWPFINDQIPKSRNPLICN